MKLSSNTDFFQMKGTGAHIQMPDQSSLSEKKKVDSVSKRQSSAGIIVLMKQTIDILEKCGFRKLSARVNQRRTRQTLWGGCADANPKTCCQTIHDCPKSSTFAL